MSLPAYIWHDYANEDEQSPGVHPTWNLYEAIDGPARSLGRMQVKEGEEDTREAYRILGHAPSGANAPQCCGEDQLQHPNENDKRGYEEGTTQGTVLLLEGSLDVQSGAHVEEYVEQTSMDKH